MAIGERVEMVRKVYVRDIKEKERLHTVFRVCRKQKNQGRSGKAFTFVYPRFPFAPTECWLKGSGTTAVTRTGMVSGAKPPL